MDGGDDPPTSVFRITPGLPETDPSMPQAWSEEFGEYYVYEKLGTGGMAIVHRAEKRSLAGFTRPVALKRMLPHVADNPEVVRSFMYEAKLASRLAHANIAQAYDLGKIDDTYFIAMEYVPGPTLTQVLHQCVLAAGAMPLPLAVAVLTQLCEALDYAHGLTDDAGKPLGIVHRDVSPGNVIVSTTGLVKLIDFGIAKATNLQSHTKVGTIKGKFAYMAPEYVAAAQIDARGDLFGLGVMAHEMLTNRRLFHAKSDMETVQNVIEMPIQPPSRWVPDIPYALDDIVMVALQRDRTQRWQNAGAMAAALRGVARELRSVVGPQQIIDWLTHTFAQKPRAEDSTLAKMIDSDDLEPSVSIEADMIVPEEARDPTPRPAGRRTERVKTPLPPVAPIRPMAPRGRGPVWIVAVIVLLGALAAGYVGFFY